jgi:hypothetical protein
MGFEALQLLSGTSMKMVAAGTEQNQQPVLARYIGCHSQRFILAAVPGKSVGAVLRVGMKVACSAVTPTAIVSFASTIEALSGTPFALAHLAYPSAVNVRNVRSAVRVGLDLAAKVANLDDVDNLEIHPAHILDMSVRGLKLGANMELGRVGDELSIHVQLAFDDIFRDITLNGKIRSRPLADSMTSTYAHVFGVEFTALDEDKRVLLHAFVLNMVQRHGAQL